MNKTLPQSCNDSFALNKTKKEQEKSGFYKTINSGWFIALNSHFEKKCTNKFFESKICLSPKKTTSA